jgi:beta-glucosidase
MDWVTGNARNADATIVVLGLSGLLEGEEGAALASPTKGDRLDLNLPKGQLDFLRKLRKDNDKPLVVVLTGGSPITMPEVEELADAILFVWYPGQQGGNAVADVLFGDVSPSGRLPITFPASVDQLPPFDDYSMQGRTYKYMTETPLFPFGYGLSYSRFEYGDVKLSSDTLQAGDPLDVEIGVRNAGDVEADEVLQVYLTIDDHRMNQPLSTLVGFQRVSLKPGETRLVAFTIDPGQLQVFNDAGEKQFKPGTRTLHIGGVSPGARGEELTGQALKTARFEIR